MVSLNGALLTEKVLAGERISSDNALELYRLPLEELGALAAQMARKALKGPLNTDRVFPETFHVAVNLTSAKSCNLTIPVDALKRVEKVIP